jgi:hypothetical protein
MRLWPRSVDTSTRIGCKEEGERMLAAAKRAAVGRVALGGVAVVLVAVTGCSSGSESRTGVAGPGAADRDAGARRAAPKSVFRLIGDGSTAFTGSQPKQPLAQRLGPGQKPPQFVVFSWDGAGEDSQKLFSRFSEVGRKYHANMTYFLSGVYMPPEDKRELYDPPKHNAAAPTSASTTPRESGTSSPR